MKKILFILTLLCASIASFGQVAQPNHGGTGQSSFTKGDLLCASNATTLFKLPVGSDGLGIVADSAQTCGVKWGSVGGTQIQVNSVNASAQTPINFLTSSAINGFTLTFTNTSLGNIQLGLSGTLNNAGITNPQVTVNGHVCTLGSTCSVLASDVGNGTAQWNANQINGVSLSGLGTGFFRNTTGTGVPTSSEISGDCTSALFVLTCQKINGNSIPSGGAVHQLLIWTLSNTAVFKTIPDCVGGSNALNYTQSTDVLSCLSITTLSNPFTTTGDVLYAVGSTPTRLAGPTGPNGVPQYLIDIPSAGAATAEQFALAGVVPRASTCGSNVDTIVVTDRAGYISWTDASPCVVTLPQAGTTGFASNFATSGCNIGAGTVTVTPTTSTISYSNGSSYTSAASSVALTTGQCIAIFSNNTDYFAIVKLDNVTANSKRRAISFSIGDPAGSALTSGSTTTAYVTVPFACTISAYNLLIDAGTVTVKFWKVATGTAIPTSGNSISTSGVSISSGTAIHSATVTDFTTTTVTKDDIMAMNVTTIATAKFVSGVLECDQ